jgi:hypothetical protein
MTLEDARFTIAAAEGNRSADEQSQWLTAAAICIACVHG